MGPQIGSSSAWTIFGAALLFIAVMTAGFWYGIDIFSAKHVAWFLLGYLVLSFALRLLSIALRSSRHSQRQVR